MCTKCMGCKDIYSCWETMINTENEQDKRELGIDNGKCAYSGKSFDDPINTTYIIIIGCTYNIATPTNVVVA